MKKFALVIAVMALVLLVGQTAFAAGSNAGLKLGYTQGVGDFNVMAATLNTSYSAFQLGLSANYYTKINVSASLKLDLGFGKTIISIPLANTLKTFMFNLHVFVKYDVFNSYGVSIAPQIGFILDSDKSKTIESPGDPHWLGHERSAIFVAAGIFVKVNITPKFELYLDAKTPVYYSYSCDYKSLDYSGFFEAIFYDITLGGLYEVVPNLFVGIDGNISTATTKQLSAYIDELDNSFTFSVGAKIEFKF